MAIRPVTLITGLAAITFLLAACGGSGSTASSESTPTGAASTSSAAAASAADIAFAQMMIPHHQQALDMANLALDKAESPEVVELAEQIKEAQDPEIRLMSEWLESWGAPQQMANDHSSHDMGSMTMEGMMSEGDMQALAGATGPEFDKLWLELMIAHHEGAITMAEDVQAGSGNAQVTALADAVISGQSAEIATMRGLLDK